MRDRRNDAFLNNVCLFSEDPRSSLVNQFGYWIGAQVAPMLG